MIDKIPNGVLEVIDADRGAFASLRVRDGTSSGQMVDQPVHHWDVFLLVDGVVSIQAIVRRVGINHVVTVGEISIEIKRSKTFFWKKTRRLEVQIEVKKT